MNTARDAADLLTSGEVEWIQNRFVRSAQIKPSACLYGLLALANHFSVADLVNAGDDIPFRSVCSERTQRAILRVVIEQYPDWAKGWTKAAATSPLAHVASLLVNWNDSTVDSQDELVRVLEKTAQLLDEEEV